MTLRPDAGLLERLGLGALAPDEGAELLAEMQLFHERQVGEILESMMSRDAFDHFFGLVGKGDVEAARSVLPHNHEEIARAGLDQLHSEIAASATAILQSFGHVLTADWDLWGDERPDPSPVLVGPPGGRELVVSAEGAMAVSVDPSRTALYAVRDDNPPVILQLPDGVRVDPVWMWCDIEGEVRARLDDATDLRWSLPSRTAEPIVRYAVTAFRERPRLERPPSHPVSSLIRQGRWWIDFSELLVVGDRVHDRDAILVSPVGEHSFAVQPHLTPDRSRLVAVYTNGVPDEDRIASASLRYIDLAMQSPDLPHWDPTIPWEHTVAPPAGRESSGSVTHIGYDLSSTRCVARDLASAHLYDMRDWRHLTTVNRPDGRALVARLDLPGTGRLRAAWAGRSVIVAGEAARLWRVDLAAGSDPDALNHGADPDQPIVAIVSGTGGAAVVLRDRTVVEVDESGEVMSRRLGDGGPVEAATRLRDGRLLVSSRGTVELWAGDRLVVAEPCREGRLVGMVPCLTDSRWALGWLDDGLVVGIRVGGHSIRLQPGHLPGGPDAPLFSRDALMVGAEDWVLLSPSRPGHEPHVVVPHTIYPVDFTSAAYLSSVDTIAGATIDSGIVMLQRSRAGVDMNIAGIPLDGPVHHLAVGACSRSLAATGEDSLWLIRLVV